MMNEIEAAIHATEYNLNLWEQQLINPPEPTYNPSDWSDPDEEF